MTTNSKKYVKKRQVLKDIQNLLNKIKNKSQRIIQKAYNSLTSPRVPFFVIFLIIYSLIFIALNYSLNLQKTELEDKKLTNEMELEEIERYRNELERITMKFSDFAFEFLDKDAEINVSISNGEMTHEDAFTILYHYVHRADIIFLELLYLLDFARYSPYIDYDILEEFTNLLIPAWRGENYYYLADDLILFEVILSNSDNISSALHFESKAVNYSLSKFKYLYIYTEDDKNLFYYNRTWDIFYNYSVYKVFNVFVNLPMYDRIVEQFYVYPLSLKTQKLKDINTSIIVTNIYIILIGIVTNIISILVITPNKIKQKKYNL